MERKRALIAGKHLIYCFGLIFCYVLQTTPGFLQIFGVKPFLVIPAVIAIAMQEGEFTGALYGALGGMLCDMGANTFYGFYTLTLFLYGAAVGLALIYLMKNDRKTAVLCCLVYTGGMALIEYIFLLPAVWLCGQLAGTAVPAHTASAVYLPCDAAVLLWGAEAVRLFQPPHRGDLREETPCLHF